MITFASSFWYLHSVKNSARSSLRRILATFLSGCDSKKLETNSLNKAMSLDFANTQSTKLFTSSSIARVNLLWFPSERRTNFANTFRFYLIRSLSSNNALTFSDYPEPKSASTRFIVSTSFSFSCFRFSLRSLRHFFSKSFEARKIWLFIASYYPLARFSDNGSVNWTCSRFAKLLFNTAFTFVVPIHIVDNSSHWYLLLTLSYHCCEKVTHELNILLICLITQKSRELL